MRYAMKNYFVALAFTALFLPVACACGTPEPARSGDGVPPGNPGQRAAKNPVFREFLVADPTVIRAEDGNFYLYATESGKNNIPILRSSDLVNWTKVGEVFTAGNHPQITDKAGANLWAPDINKIGDRYVLVLFPAGGEQQARHRRGVGPLACRALDRPRETDRQRRRSGSIFRSTSSTSRRTGTSTCSGEVSGASWAIELADHGLSLKPGAGKRKIAGDQYEGTYIHKRDGYYYLIVSTGDFMKDYHVVVGRSRSLMGPYVDRAGRDMLGVHHELVVGNGNGFVAPGHNAEFITDDKGQDWMLYHTRLEVGGPRYLLLDRIEWNDGWPEVRGHVPARSAEAPVFE